MAKKKPFQFIWKKNPLEVLSNDVDVVVELVGGSSGIAKKLIFAALKNKKHVITANKSLISKYGDELAVIAEKNKVNLEYEAAVAGGVGAAERDADHEAGRRRRAQRDHRAGRGTGRGRRRQSPVLPRAGAGSAWSGSV